MFIIVFETKFTAENHDRIIIHDQGFQTEEEADRAGIEKMKTSKILTGFYLGEVNI